MTDGPSDPTPLTTVAGGSNTAEAFQLLGNETRLAILLALWEAYDPLTGEDTASFSTLQKRVGVSDSGQFNYHLSKLEDRFVKDTEEGYRLRPAGLAFVQTVVAGAGSETEFEPTPLDADCNLCGAATVLTYEEGWLYQRCTECAGGFGRKDGYPEGILLGEPLPSSALEDRTAEELFAAAVARLFQVMNMKMAGLCPHCTGVMDASMGVCTDHDAGEGESCAACGNVAAVRISFVCRVCKYRGGASPGSAVAHHPAVVAFYHDRGVEVGYPANDFASTRRFLDLVRRHEVEVLSVEPPRVRITVRHDGDELWLTMDDRLDVVEFGEGPPAAA